MSEKASEEKQEISNKQEAEILETEKEEVKKYVTEIISSEFSGPIPPPAIIKGYEEVLPGAADRIITMAETQAQHRQELEKKMVHAESRDSLLGVLFAFLLGFSCIIAAIVIVVLVPENAGAISGSILGLAGISSIIATFINSTRSNAHSDERKTDKKK